VLRIFRSTKAACRVTHVAGLHLEALWHSRGRPSPHICAKCFDNRPRLINVSLHRSYPRVDCLDDPRRLQDDNTTVGPIADRQFREYPSQILEEDHSWFPGAKLITETTRPVLRSETARITLSLSEPVSPASVFQPRRRPRPALGATRVAVGCKRESAGVRPGSRVSSTSPPSSACLTQ
jgi:hypothetical protein